MFYNRFTQIQNIYCLLIICCNEFLSKQVFQREKNPLTPTSYGRQLYQRAHLIIAAVPSFPINTAPTSSWEPLKPPPNTFPPSTLSPLPFLEVSLSISTRTLVDQICLAAVAILTVTVRVASAYQMKTLPLIASSSWQAARVFTFPFKVKYRRPPLRLRRLRPPQSFNCLPVDRCTACLPLLLQPVIAVIVQCIPT